MFDTHWVLSTYGHLIVGNTSVMNLRPLKHKDEAQIQGGVETQGEKTEGEWQHVSIQAPNGSKIVSFFPPNGGSRVPLMKSTYEGLPA